MVHEFGFEGKQVFSGRNTNYQPGLALLPPSKSMIDPVAKAKVELVIVKARSATSLGAA